LPDGPGEDGLRLVLPSWNDPAQLNGRSWAWVCQSKAGARWADWRRMGLNRASCSWRAERSTGMGRGEARWGDPDP
jgi:hypothetical protein